MSNKNKNNKDKLWKDSLQNNWKKRKEKPKRIKKDNKSKIKSKVKMIMPKIMRSKKKMK